MRKSANLFALLCAIALFGAACEIDQVADPGVTPTLGAPPETGIERVVDAEPAVAESKRPTEPGRSGGKAGGPKQESPDTEAPPTSVGAAPTTTGAPTTTAPSTTVPTTTPSTTVPTTTVPDEPTPTVPPVTVPPTPTTLPPPPEGNPIYFNDFSAVNASDRLDQFVAYRDTFMLPHLVGASDHASTGGPGDPSCSGPDDTRPQTREEPFGHVYLCHPGGDPGKGHKMAYAMNTSGYGFAGALPDQVFTDVREVRVDVNTTTSGVRNFVEIKVLPADETFVNALPCGPDMPCNAGWDYDDIGGVAAGTNVSAGTGLVINTPLMPDGYMFAQAGTELANGDTVHGPCPTDGHCWRVETHQGNTDIRARYEHVFRDNGDGTLTFGVERADGTYAWVTAPGAFPDGPVRVVIAFHNYTGTKAGHGPGFGGNDSPSEGGFTWHWDNLTVYADTATPSLTYFGGESADHIATPDGCIAFAQGQRNTPNHTDIQPRFECG